VCRVDGRLDHSHDLARECTGCHLQVDIIVAVDQLVHEGSHVVEDAALGPHVAIDCFKRAADSSHGRLLFVIRPKT
jgi:hypothetical protein